MVGRKHMLWILHVVDLFWKQTKKSQKLLSQNLTRCKTFVRKSHTLSFLAFLPFHPIFANSSFLLQALKRFGSHS